MSDEDMNVERWMSMIPDLSAEEMDRLAPATPGIHYATVAFVLAYLDELRDYAMSVDGLTDDQMTPHERGRLSNVGNLVHKALKVAKDIP
jgi:hypothetical protein